MALARRKKPRGWCKACQGIRTACLYVIILPPNSDADVTPRGVMFGSGSLCHCRFQKHRAEMSIVSNGIVSQSVLLSTAPTTSPSYPTPYIAPTLPTLLSIINSRGPRLSQASQGPFLRASTPNLVLASILRPPPLSSKPVDEPPTYQSTSHGPTSPIRVPQLAIHPDLVIRSNVCLCLPSPHVTVGTQTARDRFPDRDGDKPAARCQAPPAKPRQRVWCHVHQSA